MLENCTIRVKAGVRAKLASSGIDPNDITGLDDVFFGYGEAICWSRKWI